MKFRKIAVTIEPASLDGEVRTLKIMTTVDDGPTQTTMQSLPAEDFESYFRRAVGFAVQQIEAVMRNKSEP